MDETEVETDTDTEVEMKTGDDPGEADKVAVSAEELERGLKRVFGDSALATRIKDEGEHVVVDGDGWEFVFRGDGSLVFKPGGSAYRLVRSIEDLETVGSHREGGAVSFVFGEEEITLRRGVEHRR